MYLLFSNSARRLINCLGPSLRVGTQCSNAPRYESVRRAYTQPVPTETVGTRANLDIVSSLQVSGYVELVLRNYTDLSNSGLPEFDLTT